jgi:hypothetical protein
MTELECPWCQEPVHLEMAVLSAEACRLRCDGCSVEVEIGDQPSVVFAAIAA